MNDAQKQFLAREYQSLWKDFGALPLEHRKLSADAVPDGPLAQPEAVPPTPEKLAPSADTVSAVVESVSPAGLRTLEQVRRDLGSGCGCTLCPSRKNLVFGTGSPSAKLVFVGDAPGAEEDSHGIPFRGAAGELLTKIIEAMGYTRESVYLTQVVKCRTPQNRAPQPDEVAACLPFLRGQIDALAPQIVVALGPVALAALVGPGDLAQMRGRFHPLQWNPQVNVMPTYHPAYLLRSPATKKIVWEDMKQVMAQLERS